MHLLPGLLLRNKRTISCIIERNSSSKTEVYNNINKRAKDKCSKLEASAPRSVLSSASLEQAPKIWRPLIMVEYKWELFSTMITITMKLRTIRSLKKRAQMRRFHMALDLSPSITPKEVLRMALISTRVQLIWWPMMGRDPALQIWPLVKELFLWRISLRIGTQRITFHKHLNRHRIKNSTLIRWAASIRVMLG